MDELAKRIITTINARPQGQDLATSLDILKSCIKLRHLFDKQYAVNVFQRCCSTSERLGQRDITDRDPDLVVAVVRGREIWREHKGRTNFVEYANSVFCQEQESDSWEFVPPE